MEKMDIYSKGRAVPDKAKRPIQAGRLKGKTDINPMWRIKVLTEMFGPCGVGWRYEITDQWIVPAGDQGQVAAFCNINLYYKIDIDGEWSAPVPGTGGNMFVAQESKGLYVNDECYKSALTDAISVACKALGIGADVYWNEDSTKYTNPVKERSGQEQQPSTAGGKCSVCGCEIPGTVYDFSVKKFGKALCIPCQRKEGGK